jgi:hypothetical protein
MKRWWNFLLFICCAEQFSEVLPGDNFFDKRGREGVGRVNATCNER